MKIVETPLKQTNF